MDANHSLSSSQPNTTVAPHKILVASRRHVVVFVQMLRVPIVPLELVVGSLRCLEPLSKGGMSMLLCLVIQISQASFVMIWGAFQVVIAVDSDSGPFMPEYVFGLRPDTHVRVRVQLTGLTESVV